jgi:hypothetical protein
LNRRYLLHGSLHSALDLATRHACPQEPLRPCRNLFAGLDLVLLGDRAYVPSDSRLDPLQDLKQLPLIQ